MPTCPVSMAYGVGFGWLVILWLLQIAHTQRGPVEHIEFYSDYGSNHDEERLHYSHQYHISDAASQVHILHREQRQGDHVSGSYSHLEPNGHVRSVHYEVRGPSRGFRAVVEQRTGNSRVHQALEFRSRQPLRALALAEPVAFVI
ncbi:cuticle protein 7 [Drosophila biarmipes]|uniref:cuticle protein 7 n=1 Tax=Drosophila biarmipes TaxID=125945 RepID=UPI0007E76855|nr:cuticle protein 7 [Drosophila biarmipes]XP_050741980.1 cuticle protein 7 [Drosophila biarmipes]